MFPNELKDFINSVDFIVVSWIEHAFKIQFHIRQ